MPPQKLLPNLALVAALSLLPACASKPRPFKPKRDRRPLKVKSPERPKVTLKTSPKLLSLDSALRLAMAHSPRLKASEGAIDAAAARAIQARLWPNPRLSVGSEDGAVDNKPGLDSGKVTVGLQQTLPITGILSARAKAARKNREVALLNYEIRVRELFGDVRRAYNNLLLAQRLRQVSSGNLALASQLQRRARERTRSGAAPETETIRADIEVAEGKVALRDATIALETSKQTLRGLLAHPKLLIPRLTDKLPEGFPKLSASAIERAVLSSHPRLVHAEARIEAAQAGLKVAKKAWLPQPRVNLAVGRQREDSVNTVFEWNLSLPLPLFNRNQGTQAALKAEVRRARYQARAIKIEILSQLQQALIRYRQQRQQVQDYQRRILPLSQRSLTLIRKQYQLGKLSQMNVLDAQRTVIRTQRTALKLLQRLLSTTVELEQLSGQALRRFTQA